MADVVGRIEPKFSANDFERAIIIRESIQKILGKTEADFILATREPGDEPGRPVTMPVGYVALIIGVAVAKAKTGEHRAEAEEMFAAGPNSGKVKP